MASYQPVTQEFLAQLESIVPGRVTAGSEVNPDYGRDEMPIYGVHPPEAAVEILSTEEAAAVVKLCYAHNIPVTTRGAGTGLVGGCVPVFGGVVLSTARMNRILGYDLENFTVTVQPGVLLQQLAEDGCASQRYPCCRASKAIRFNHWKTQKRNKNGSVANARLGWMQIYHSLC